MKTTNYAGIDYSLGRSNVDVATGIHYGVISQHSLMPEALDEIYMNGEDLAWQEALKEAIAEAVAQGADPDEVDEESIAEELGMNWESSLSGIVWEKQGYKLTGCLDYDVFVLKSPYYTHAQFCSPCVPGAGNLDSPCAEGPKSYCLGHDWFEGNKAPYPVYSVETGELVNPE